MQNSDSIGFFYMVFMGFAFSLVYKGLVGYRWCFTGLDVGSC